MVVPGLGLGKEQLQAQMFPRVLLGKVLWPQQRDLKAVCLSLLWGPIAVETNHDSTLGFTLICRVNTSMEKNDFRHVPFLQVELIEAEPGPWW